MKFLRNTVDKIKPAFEKGGKYAKLHPVFDAFETFLFVPNETTPKKGAQIRDAVDMKRLMNTVIVAMIPCLLFGIWNVGHQHFLAQGEVNAELLDKILVGAWVVLPIVIVSYVAGLGVEFLFAVRNGHPVSEGFLVSGMLIPLVMPPTIPLWQVAVATIFAVVVAKEVFGGTGMNILNIAMTARAFLYFAYPVNMAGDVKVWTYFDDPKQVVLEEKVDGNISYSIVKYNNKEADGSTGATSLGLASETSKILNQKIVKAEKKYVERKLEEKGKGLDENQMDALEEELIVEAKNSKEVKALEAQIPTIVERTFNANPSFSTLNLIWGIIPGSIGETSLVMCLIGAFILIATGVGSWKIIVSGFTGAYALALLFNALGSNAFMLMPAHYHLMMGGLAFGIVYMATDPVSAAQTETGKWVYGFLIGALTVLIRVFNPAYPEGIMLAVLFMNVMAPLIDYYVVEANKNRRLKRLKLKTA